MNEIGLNTYKCYTSKDVDIRIAYIKVVFQNFPRNL
jgi:hypothetical protein